MDPQFADDSKNGPQNKDTCYQLDTDGGLTITHASSIRQCAIEGSFFCVGLNQSTAIPALTLWYLQKWSSRRLKGAQEGQKKKPALAEQMNSFDYA